VSLADALAPLVDAVFPPRCPLCGGGIAQHGDLCARCWHGLAFPTGAACGHCGQPLAPEEACLPCAGAAGAAVGAADSICAATRYNPAARQLALALKRGGKLALAPLMVRLMLARLAAEGRMPGPGWLVVPVPLHRWRLWRRGFNQSALLARGIARASGARLVVDGLQRVRATRSLGDLGAEERRAELAGAIAASRRRTGLLHGARVLLVDDVVTSGATSGACVAALRAAAARQVHIACFARVATPAPRPGGRAEALEPEPDA